MLTPLDPDPARNPGIQPLLANLQSGILKAHGLNHVQLIRLKFAGVTASSEAREWLKALLAGNHLTNTNRQLNIQGAYRQALDAANNLFSPRKWAMTLGLVRTAQSFVEGEEATVFSNLLLTHAGYEFFGRPAGHADHPRTTANPVAIPAENDPFIRGQRNRPTTVLGDDAGVWSSTDWPSESWHALLMVSSSDETLARKKINTLLKLAPAQTFARTAALPPGKQQRQKGKPVEHFGYVDGISNLVFLSRDYKKAAQRGLSPSWDPVFPLEQVIVDRQPDSPRCGSFLVLRQLEQNTAAFHRITATDQLIGRGRDGTPLPPPLPPFSGATNAFDFGTLGAPLPASRCPFHAHIRKANPRGSSNTDPAVERAVAVARRGITYGERQTRTNGEFTDLPSTGVGLHFMAYMSNIGAQFEHMQQKWFNRPDFPTGPGAGLDLLVGRDHNQNIPANETPVVRTMGGEYFFAPPLSLLRVL